MTPLRVDVGATIVPSMDGAVALARLRLWLDLHQRVMRGIRRDKKKNRERSRSCHDSFNGHWPARWWGSPPLHPPRPPPLLTHLQCQHLHQVRLACRDLVCPQIWRVCATTTSSSGWCTSLPQAARVMCLSLGTRWLNQAIEGEWWRTREWHQERRDGSSMVQRQWGD
jgi:hypothetical protein